MKLDMLHDTDQTDTKGRMPEKITLKSFKTEFDFTS